MTKAKIKAVLQQMDLHYPHENKCYLNYNADWQLLIATILSAQCTDDRVNIVTERLFAKYTDIADFAEAELSELEKDIKPTGFYHMKARNIRACCQALIERHGGVLPSSVEELTALAGVGRKTANVVRGHIFNIPSIVVDTHVKRLSNRIGFVKEEDPVKIEMKLYKALPKEHWIKYNTQMIAHGRKICKSQRPKCAECFLNADKLCAYAKAEKSDKPKRL